MGVKATIINTKHHHNNITSIVIISSISIFVISIYLLIISGLCKPFPLSLPVSFRRFQCSLCVWRLHQISSACSSSQCSGSSSQPAPTSGCSTCGTQVSTPHLSHPRIDVHTLRIQCWFWMNTEAIAWLYKDFERNQDFAG